MSNGMQEILNKTFGDKVFDREVLVDQEFSRCVFSGCSFIEADFSRSRFIDCTFKDCHLLLTRFYRSEFQNVIFFGSKISGVVFSECCTGLVFSISFLETKLINCDFSSMNLKRFSFIGSVIEDCDFTHANLSGADFSDTDLKGSRFQYTDLSRTDFSSSVNYTINPNENTLCKTKFSYPQAQSLLGFFDVIVQ